ncbi:hypothetical protein L3Y34_003337 [Caenorhabditis briggsae]|uniref:UBX domain-containing protein n=2 Tax=Caenorhabditis briggsae TaxID=6238 RepID=A0AAE9A604_CAEBR|nr:hypothetical protein L3Y34_003337 [Caenorhabditis briggsae]
MNKFKKFFAKKRTENHFKHSGEGQKLSESSGASSSTSRVVDRDVQAEAALRRLQKTEPPQDASKKRIQMMAKKQLEDERRQMEELKITEASRPPEPQELDHSQVISNILYYSELLGEEHARTKSELLEDIKTFLLEQVAEAEDESDKVIAAVLMLYSLNQREVKEKAIETICKLCQNILEHPGEEKYKTIRLTNEAILTRVINPVGGRAFLEAVGFMERTNSEGVPQMVFDRETDFHLIEALEALRNGQAVPIKVSRNLEVFKLKLGQEVKAPKVPDAFYNLSAAEIKAEQKNKSKEVESMLTLRTKEMRQRDEKSSNNKYKYTAIRVRLPGNLAVQGVFNVFEPFSAVREFVASVLSDAVAASEFRLYDRIKQHVDDESVALVELGLVPSAYLHLTFLDNIDESTEILAPNHLERLHDLQD